MAINPAAVGTSTFELLDGSVSSFYADVDEAIAASEVVKGQYRMTINPAYNSPNPVDSNSFTTVGLTQSGPMVVDLENSYITTNVEVLIKPDANLPLLKANNAEGGEKQQAFSSSQIMFVGWKRSIEAIERYDILVNSTPIYTQSFCGEESFIMSQVENDLVRKKSPFITTTYHNIQNLEPGVCGTFIVFDGNADAATKSEVSAANGISALIPIKIPVANFPILRNLKYLLSWMGKWEIRLYFSTQNMIQCLVNPDTVKLNVAKPDGDHPYKQFYENKDCHIVQLGSPIVNWQRATPPTEADHGFPKARETIWHSEKMTLHDVSMNTAQFQIRMDILEMLKQKYMMEKPLTFPVSTFQIARFTGPPPSKVGDETPLSIVLCQAINNCDTMFVLPFEHAHYHTICHNPQIKSLQLHAGEYGAYPTQPFNTFWDYGEDNIRFVNAAMDALNLNGSELTSFNEDVVSSFVPIPMLVHRIGDASEAGATAAVRFAVPINGSHALKDDSNFFIPFSFSTDDDFQGGLSSPSSNINFKLTGTLVDKTIAHTTPWVAVFLIDGVVMIRPDPGSDAAKVIWSDRTVC